MTDENIILKYNLQSFNDIFRKYDSIPINDDLNNKVNFFRNKYICFNPLHDPKKIFEKKKFNKKEIKTPKNKFHIIMHDFSNEETSKRQLIGFLNKLTSKNKETIFDKIKDIILNNNNNDNFFNLVLSYIRSHGCDIYVEILDLFDNEIRDKNINSLWNSYIENKEWLPPEYILKNNILHLDDQYDMYCDYTKWKKEVNNMNMLWIYLKKDIDYLVNDIYDFFEKYLNKINVGEINEYIVYKHVLDLLLEQISKISIHCDISNIVGKLKELDISLMENSTKFSIYNILDKK